MYLRRKVDAFLEEWIADPARKPLIIKGSRQIGKTESVLHFAAAHYESIIEINFVRDVKYKNIIADGYETSNIIKNISLLDPSRRFIPGKTLIFFDEITEFPEIAASLKFFCIDKFISCAFFRFSRRDSIFAIEFDFCSGIIGDSIGIVRLKYSEV